MAGPGHRTTHSHIHGRRARAGAEHEASMTAEVHAGDLEEKRNAGSKPDRSAPQAKASQPPG